ncbi:MAG: ABC transporter substrate-binding protein [Methylobacteriaceae bacterium]|nr:ABC transporter substrate-binding protein [Methylobacteriaceae bacterium]
MIGSGQKLWFAAGLTLAALAAGVTAAKAQKKYGPGASDTEIKLGQTMPYSGPASAYGTIGKTEAAYFQMINDQGGVNGRKINLISYDDGYSPPKTVEQVRKLVESDEVLATFQTLGTAPNTAIMKYMNAKKVPMLFVSTGAAKFTDPKNFPWTIGYNPSYVSEAHVYAQYIAKEKPNAKIAMLTQNDDFGRDYLKGWKEVLGSKANMIVAEATYEVTDPTVDSQMLKLKASGADVLFNGGTPKFAAQAIKKAAELDWHPLQILNINSISVSEVLTPAGVENAKGLLTINYGKDPADPKWKDDAGMKKYFEFMDKYYPSGVKDSVFNTYGYGTAELMVQVLKQCGDDLTRENLMKQATNIKDFAGSLGLPGMSVTTTHDDYRVIQQFQMQRFDGTRWELFGPILSDEMKSQG